MRNNVESINKGMTALGIELGSTRIKAVLVDGDNNVLAQGGHAWENKFVNNLWTYSLEDVWTGVQSAYGDLRQSVEKQYGVKLTKIGSIGISAMMHGYLVFDKEGNLLVPFRTWRNNNAQPASEYLTKLFNYHIPARWSIAHLYQAISSYEPHVRDIAYQTSLEGYIHWKLTGRKVIGIGEASGMFPVDLETKQYDSAKLAQFNEILRQHGLDYTIEDIYPTILLAGEDAGSLTEEGARLLDISGDLQKGVPLCPPEGDAGTGMIATNSIRPRTGNVSAGTSIFGMVVAEKQLSKVYSEVDLVTTPVGDLVAMVHCNNCTSDINAWTEIFSQFATLIGSDLNKNELYTKLFKESLKGDDDCGGIVNVNYVSGEHLTGVEKGRPMVVRSTDSKFSLSNFMRSQLYSSMATLKIGLDLLLVDEKIKVDKMYAHGGLFKTEGVCQEYLAAAINAPVTVAPNAGEGGAWGMAILANYLLHNESSLADYLDNSVFGGATGKTVLPDKQLVDGFNAYVKRFKGGLDLERAAVTAMED